MNGIALLQDHIAGVREAVDETPEDGVLGVNNIAPVDTADIDQVHQQEDLNGTDTMNQDVENADTHEHYALP